MTPVITVQISCEQIYGARGELEVLSDNSGQVRLVIYYSTATGIIPQV
jgi:hypothetical protein